MSIFKPEHLDKEDFILYIYFDVKYFDIEINFQGRGC